MKLRARCVADVLEILASRLITKEEWTQAVRSWGRNVADLDTLTLDQYGTMCETQDDFALYAEYKRAKGERIPRLGDPAQEFMEELGSIVRGMERITQAFDAIPRIAMSTEEKAAGFGSRNFGLFGIVDTLARRQNITDDEAKAMPLSSVIGKLTIDAHQRACEKRYNEICRLKTQIRR